VTDINCSREGTTIQALWQGRTAEQQYVAIAGTHVKPLALVVFNEEGSTLLSIEYPGNVQAVSDWIVCGEYLLALDSSNGNLLTLNIRKASSSSSLAFQIAPLKVSKLNSCAVLLEFR
jgi:hypothetical protein